MIGTRRRSLWLATLIVMLGVPSRLLAQCAFDAPTNAKGIKTSMVRAYAGCVGGITFPASNTSTMAGVPGCTPPFPLSPYRFADDKSGCTISIKTKYSDADVCPGTIQSGPCMDSTMKAKCTGVLDGMGQPSNDPGFAIQILVRTTFDDGAGDMTISDFPAQFAAPQMQNGAFGITIVPFQSGCELFECLKPPGCTSVQILNVSLFDPDGNIFAVTGSSSR
jgi:hypothetical protein